MIQAKCIEKFRDKHNQIYGYRLQDQQGNIKDVTSDQLKQAIRNQQINIINLQLDKAGRLVDKTEKPDNKPISPANNDEIKACAEEITNNLKRHYLYYSNKDILSFEIDNVCADLACRYSVATIDHAVEYIVNNTDESRLVHTVMFSSDTIIGYIYDCKMLDLIDRVFIKFKDSFTVDKNNYAYSQIIYSKRVGGVKSKFDQVQQKDTRIGIYFDSSEYNKKNKEALDIENKEKIKKYNAEVDKYNAGLELLKINYNNLEKTQGKKAVVKEYLATINELFPYNEDHTFDTNYRFTDVFYDSDMKLEHQEFKEGESYYQDSLWEPKKYLQYMPEPVRTYIQHLCDVLAQYIINGNDIDVTIWSDNNEENEKRPIEDLISSFPQEIKTFQKSSNCSYSIIVSLVDIMMKDNKDKIACFNLNDCYSYLGQAPDHKVYTSSFKGLFKYLNRYAEWYTDEDGYPMEVITKGMIQFVRDKDDDYGRSVDTLTNKMLDKFYSLPDKAIAKACEDYDKVTDWDAYSNKLTLLYG